MSTPTVDLSDQAKAILTEVFANDSIKIAVIDKSIKFVLAVISKEKIDQYSLEVKNIIAIEQRNDLPAFEAIGILSCITNILEDLYAHLESIKVSELSANDRTFVKEHIDVIAQVVIVLAFDAIEDKNIVNQQILVLILSFVRVAAVLNINMKVKKCIGFCCTKAQ